MKKYFILAALLCFSSILLYSQNIIDPPKLSQFDTSPVVDKNFNGFIIGWNWGTPGAMLDSAMYINTYHGFDFESDDYLEDTYVMVPPVKWDSYIVGGRNNNYIFNAHCLYFDPSLIVDTSQSFIPRANDNTGAVMGFMDRDSIVSQIEIEPNGNGHLVLFQNCLNDDSAKVLSNIWKNDCLRWLDYDGGDMGGSANYRTNAPTEFFNDSLDRAKYHVFNGKLWYISINLRALNLNEIQNNLDSTVLVIKMPYTLKKLSPLTYTQGYTKFNLLPRDSIANVAQIIGSRNDYRGAYRQLDSSVNKPTEFIIKGNMLQTIDTNTRQITISALAFFDGIPYLGGYRNNPCFQNDWYQNLYNLQEYISKIDLEVYYYGHLDVAIDWIKIETPRAQQIFRGFYDTNVSNAVDSLFDFVGNHSKHLKINRIYANDELIPSQWAANRYFNMLVDTLAAVECFVHQGNTPSHFLHSTGFKEYWNGGNIDFYSNNGVPFVKRAEYNCPSTFNYYWGYSGLTEGMQPKAILDSLHSDYETKLFGPVVTLPVTDLNIYEYPDGSPNHYYSNSTQFQIEKSIYQKYYKNPSLFYSSKPWWANLWVQADGLKYYNVEINSFTVNGWSSRPKTGEEIRLMATLPVLLGAKGLLYWKKETEANFQTGGWIGLQPYVEGYDYQQIYGNLSGEELLKSNALGGDYVCFPDANNFDDVYNNDAYLFDVMGIDSNHIYIGLASTRLAISRVNKWVQNCEAELMKLRLVAWYGKGFLTLYHQDPAFGTDTIMKNFLSLDVGKIKTRQIDRYFQYKYVNPDYEPWDSSFVDITLLRNIDTTMNDVFYVSALNRRTDPLIYYQPPSSSGTPPNPYIRFLSTAEFEDSCDATKNPNGYERIRSYWWEKLGAREVSIKFNYQNSENNDEYALLRVTEIGAEEEFDENWSYGKKQSFWNKIDTVIGQDSQLPVKLQPAEGKIFRVQVIHQDTTVTGILAHSNQSKLISNL